MKKILLLWVIFFVFPLVAFADTTYYDQNSRAVTKEEYDKINRDRNRVLAPKPSSKTPSSPDSTKLPSKSASVPPAPSQSQSIYKPSSSDSEYEIIETKNLSNRFAKRISYRVGVPHEMTKPELSSIAEKIVQKTNSENKVDAITMSFYLPGTDSSGPFTAGKAVWAPGGDWDKASSKIEHAYRVIAGHEN